MKNRISNLIIGVVFVLIGIVYAGNVLGLWHVNLFFDGWWTLFIIVPCVLSVIRSGFHVGNSIGLTIGVLLLLSRLDIIELDLVGKLLVPVIVILIGLGILFRDGKHRVVIPNHVQKNTQAGSEYTAIFAAQDIKYPAQPFEGCTLTAIFGGIDLDLRDAMITGDVVITSTTIFGGADIMVPPNVKVRVSSTPIFGGTSNSNKYEDPNAPTIYLNATCIFGGAEIQ